MYFFKTYFVFLFILLLSLTGKSQVVGNILIISPSDPSGLNVCYNQTNLKIYFENPSPFTLQNVLVDIDMPIGTNIVAMRSGIVVKVIENFKD